MPEPRINPPEPPEIREFTPDDGDWYHDSKYGDIICAGCRAKLADMSDQLDDLAGMLRHEELDTPYYEIQRGVKQAQKAADDALARQIRGYAPWGTVCARCGCKETTT